MSSEEILAGLQELPLQERLRVVQAALHLIREDLKHLERTGTPADKREQLATAAKALLADYESDSELTIFTSLDREDFHA